MRFEVEVTETDNTFIDFKEVDETLRALIEPMDHAMVLWDNDPLLSILTNLGFRTQAMRLEPTTENIARWTFNYMSKRYNVLRVTVYETDKYSATAREA